MAMLTTAEQKFLEVYLHEATTPPFFQGPASKGLSAIGVEYRDVSYLAWAYEQDVPRTRFELGRAADVAPPLPWPNRESVLRRDNEIRRLWAERRESSTAGVTPHTDGIGESRRIDREEENLKL